MTLPEQSDAEKSKARTKVLIADDEKVIADTLVLILEQRGFDATAVYAGTSAVETAQRWQPDLFLSDVMMPDLNGIEAAIQIRSVFPKCKVVLFSGKAMMENMLEGARERGYDFEIIYKPIHPAELIDVLHRTMRY